MIEVIRELVGRVEALEQASANMIVSGTVSQTDHAKGLYKIEYGDDDNRVESPWLRPQEHAGTISSHMPFKKGQQVHMLSKGGEIGKQSWIVPAGHSDANPRHSDDGDAPSWQVGQSSITMKGEEIIFKCGDSVINIRPDVIRILSGDSTIYVSPKEILTIGLTRLDNGTQPLHRVGDVDWSGDKARTGNDRVLA